eukprot:TRINITY_DN14196_c0_g1_i1.p1 TRINITY_DN14196_c0_g1~~TRINITY_DN14196_c0_g1_i1.p1  ORF type:complete len:572 (-),score=157.83 TRINITY_DN14196_c0_g1_i1:70-1785(-)
MTPTPDSQIFNLAHKVNMKLLFLALCATLVYCHFTNPLESLRYLEDNEEVFSVVSAASLVASPKELKGATEMVTIQISGVENPTKNDILALYSPANADPKKSSPVKFLSATKFKGDYLNTGKATAQIQVLNMHADVSFILYKNVGQKWPKEEDKMKNLQFVAKSNAVAFKNPRIPNQGHIAFTTVPGEIRVMWATDSKPSSQALYLGTSTGKYPTIIKGNVGGYSSSELCGSPAKDWGWKEPGILYDVVLRNLTMGKKYFYKFGSNETGFSQEAQFRAPSPSPTTKSVNFVCFGDLGKFTPDGTSEHWNAAHDSMLTVQNVLNRANQTDFVLHIGDIAYAVGYSAQWDEFMHQIQSTATRVPWMTLPGNHERDFPNSGSLFDGKDSGGECGVPYERRFIMPAAPKKPWYSFDYGPVHIVGFSTEVDFLNGSEQLKWMAKDLASVNRKKTPWVVVAGHRPMYAVTAAAERLRGSVEPLLEKFNVDVAFWGHVHNYERTCPMAKGKCQNGKTTHVVLGMGGFGINKDLKNKYDYIKQNIGESGYGQIYADQKTFKLQFLNSQDKVRDSFTLTK